MKHPNTWLAFLRVAVGLWFLKALTTKLHWTLLGGIVPFPTVSERWIHFLPQKLAQFASENPVEWYKTFLLKTAIPHAKTFAALTAFGESGVGLGLTLGLLTGLSALVGLFIMANYFLASHWIGLCQQGFHLLLMACMLAFFGARAGRSWGIDGLLARWFPSLTRIPFFL